MSPRFRTSSLLTTAVFAMAAKAQVHELWSHAHDGPSMQFDYPERVVVGADGSTYVTGFSFPAAGGIPNDDDIETVAYDPSGNLRWAAHYASPGGGTDTGSALVLSAQGNVYVLGGTRHVSASSDTSQEVLIEYDSAGAMVFSRSYGDPAGSSYGAAMCIDANGNLFLGGGDRSTTGPSGLSVRKVDPAGNELWVATYAGFGLGYDSANAMILASNGDILAAGETDDPATGNSDMLLVRVSPTGAVLWGRQIDSGAGGADHAFDLAVDPTGNAYVAGQFILPAQAGSSQALLAFDPAGTLSWTKSITGGGSDLFARVRVDPFGRIVAAGSIQSALGIGSDLCVSVFDAAGNAVWTRTWDGPNHLDDSGSALAVDGIGNVHVAGWATTHIGFGSHTAAVALEYDPSGSVRYESVHASSDPVQGLAYYLDMAVGPGGTVSLAGVDDGPASSNGDMIVVRLERTAVPYCFGDGSGTACPCANASAPAEQSGCSSSLGLGARLIDSGASSLSADTFVLTGSSMSNSACLYFQGTLEAAGGAGVVFGDGLRCASGTVVRLSTKTNSNGASQFPSSGDPSVSVRGGITAIGERTYQVWFRNAAAFCTPSTFNLSNGLRVTWVP